MTKTCRLRWPLGCLTFVGIAGTALLASAAATAVPYPVPPGYIESWDQGYDTMTPKVGSQYFLSYTSQLLPVCNEELRLAQATRPPANANGFLDGCVDAARHALGIFYPCDRNGDDPVCPRRP